jgi:hypothetical protein
MLGWAVTLRLRWQLTTQSSTIRSTARTNLRLTCGPHLTFQALQGAHGCDESAQQNSPNFIAFRLRHDHDIMVRTLVQFHQCRRTGSCSWRTSSSPRPCTTSCRATTSGRRRSARAWTRSSPTPTSPSSTSPTPTAPPSSPRSAKPAAPMDSSRFRER